MYPSQIDILKHIIEKVSVPYKYSFPFFTNFLNKINEMIAYEYWSSLLTITFNHGYTVAPKLGQKYKNYRRDLKWYELIACI